MEPVFHNAGGPLKVPGFGHPVELLFTRKIVFDHGMNSFQNQRLLVREIAMLAVMDALTDKPRWHEKVFDEAVVEQWRAEAVSMPLISPLAWKWCLRELREKAAFQTEHGFVKTLDTGSVCAKGDDLIDAQLRDELLAGVQPLLDVKDAAKDWHPNSNEQVLNLVHPPLFPLVYGRTHVLQEGIVGLSDCLESCGKGTVAPQPTFKWKRRDRYNMDQDWNIEHFSNRFQWLPAEIKFKGAGEDVESTSYINNLHPIQHRGLYSTISKITSKAIPMWNEVLVRGSNGRVPPRIKAWVWRTKASRHVFESTLIRFEVCSKP